MEVGAQETSVLMPYEVQGQGHNEVGYGIRSFNHIRDEASVFRLRFEGTRSSLFIIHGVTDRLELGAALPYLHSSRRDIGLVGSAGYPVSESRHGSEDPIFQARYSIAREDELGLALTAGLQVKPDMSGGSNAFARESASVTPSATIGMTLRPGLKAFARYGYTKISGAAGDVQSFSAGAKQALSERIELLATLNYWRVGKSDIEEVYGARGAEIAVYLQLADDLYVVPSLSEVKSRPHNRIDVPFPYRIGEGRTRQMGLQLHHVS
jgi:hypothetical protein